MIDSLPVVWHAQMSDMNREVVMLMETGHETGLYHLRLDSTGRIRLPIALRERLGISNGDSIVLVDGDDEVRLETAAQALLKAQEYFESFVPDGVSLADELLQERRDEAGHE